MSHKLRAALELLQSNDYASVVLITAVVYDYFLTLSREIEYVWCRPWSLVSVLFVVVRYFGLCWAILAALLGTTLVPGPIQVSVRTSVGYCRMNGTCAFPIFIAAANLVMILRVYAIWNQSRRILTLLLSIFVPGVVTSIVFVGIYSNPHTHVSVTILQLADKFSVCKVTFNDSPMLLLMYMGIPRIALGVTLLTLSAIRATRQLVEMQKATKQWRLNQCIRRLVRDGVLYLLLNALYNVAIGFNREPSVTNTAMLIVDMACTIAMAAMMPRFIIHIREMYDPDPIDDWQAVDSEFRVLPRAISRQSVTVSMDSWQNPSGEGTEFDSADVAAIEILREYMRRL